MLLPTSSLARPETGEPFASAIKKAVLPSGVVSPYLDPNPAGSTPVILLHGITDSCASYKAILAHLPTTVRPIAVTQRGHGDANIPETYAIADFAADLANFMDVLDLERAVLVGHSMGSLIAQQFAIHHPERVISLVLIGAFAAIARNPACIDFGRTEIASLSDPISPAFVREFQASTLAQPIPGPMMEEVVAESLKVPARVWKAAWSALLETDITADLSRIRAPTLIVWGDKDSLALPAEQQILLGSIANTRFEIFAGAGHAPHWEEPQRFAALAAEFASAKTRITSTA
jgi:pimeloyl-ACP methyl ester carboxylesterase